jgi:hypothetical protein
MNFHVDLGTDSSKPQAGSKFNEWYGFCNTSLTSLYICKIKNISVPGMDIGPVIFGPPGSGSVSLIICSDPSPVPDLGPKPSVNKQTNLERVGFRNCTNRK